MTHTDAETELRTRFARTADQIPVGPPPTGDGLRAAAERGGRRRRTWRAVTVAAAAGGIVTVAVVSSRLDTGPEESAAPPADAPASESPPERLRLDCPNDLRSILHIDDFTPEGAASPVAVAMPYVDQAAGETIRVTKGEARSRAWILRPDGTARARLDVMYRARYDGWLLGTVMTCGDESLVPPGNRP